MHNTFYYGDGYDYQEIMRQERKKEELVLEELINLQIQQLPESLLKDLQKIESDSKPKIRCSWPNPKRVTPKW